MRYFVELAFNGSNFNGWQRQPNAPTVQQKLNECFSTYLQQEVDLMGCGRTDTSVHAKQFYAHFDVNNSLPEKALFHLNSMLPSDIALKRFIEVEDDNHARFDATHREYQYRIISKKDPFEINSALLIHDNLDVRAMNKAAKLIIGNHHFGAFARAMENQITYLCDVSYAFWMEEEDVLTFTIAANRFLRNMVRALVGTFVDIGRGKISAEQILSILDSKDRSNAGSSVAGEGLYLTQVEYPYIK
jgi:tRNA pseudouridine38-40 synthase